MPLTHFLLHFKRSGRYLGGRLLGEFGDGAEIRPGAYLVETRKISLGRNVVIRPGSMLFASPSTSAAFHITVEDDVLLGSGVHIYVSNHAFGVPGKTVSEQGHTPVAPVALRRGCWLGAGCVVLPGVTVGENSVVAAGSVVTRSVPPNVLAAGVPARVIRRFDDPLSTESAQVRTD